MYFDVLTLAAVADEIRERILHGRVQKTVLLDPLTLGLEIYGHHQRHYLLANADPENARVHLTDRKVRSGVETPSPLLELLRKYVGGARLREVGQPQMERILHLTFEGTEGRVTLVIEVMGRYSNIILTDRESTILDLIKRVPPGRSRYRTLMPRKPYVPPPRQDKVSYISLTPGRLRAALDQKFPAGEESPEDEPSSVAPMWRGLVRAVAGMSPLLAREVVYRVRGDPEATVAPTAGLLEEMSDLLSLPNTRAWAPSVAAVDGRPTAFAPYSLTHLRFEPVASISEAVERFYGPASHQEPYAALRSRLVQLTEEQRTRAETRHESLRRSLEKQAELHVLRRYGEAILAYAHSIQPGQDELIAEWEIGQQLRIPLDPRVSAVDNAQRYFREYEKAKAARDQVPDLLQRAEAKIAYLDQLATDLMLAEDEKGLRDVERELVRGGFVHAGRVKGSAKPSEPLRIQAPMGFVVLVGRNAEQNEMVTFQHASSDDLWLHARGVPGAHVVALTGGRTVPESTLVRAAELAAHYSSCRGSTGALVDYTLRRHVRRIRDAGAGMVIYGHEKTIRVEPRS